MAEVAAFRDVQVTVVNRETLEPLPGIEVELSYRHAGNDARVTLFSNDQGQVVFAIPSGAQRLYAKALASRTTAPSNVHFQWTLAAQNEWQLGVGIGGELRGQVVDTEGRPVPDCEVSLWYGDDFEQEPQQRVSAGGDGHFALEHVGSSFHLQASGGAHWVAAEGLRGSLRDGQVAEGLKLVVDSPVFVEGYLRNPEGEPLEGVHVWVPDGTQTESSDDVTRVDGVTRFRAGEVHTVTEELGYFRLSGLPQRKSFSLWGHPRPYLFFMETVRPGGIAEIVADPGLSLRGRVVDARGRSVADAEVTWGPYFGNLHSSAAVVRSDERGYFEIVGLSPRYEPWIAANAPGYALSFLHQVAFDTAEVELRLQPEQHVRGRVVDVEGTPLPGITVRLQSDRTVENEFIPSLQYPSTIEYLQRKNLRVTSSTGEFHFDSFASGRCTLYAYADKKKRHEVSQSVQVGDEAVELVLDPEIYRGVIFTGRVLDEVTGEPIRKFSVSPTIGGRGMSNPFLDAEGNFEVDGVTPGRIALQVSAAGYAPWSHAAHFERGEHEFEVRLMQVRTLELAVTDEHGKPLQNGSVQVRDETLPGTPHVWLSEGASSRSTRVPVRDGRAHLHGIPARQVVLELYIQEQLRREIPIDLTHEVREVLAVSVARPDPRERVSLRMVFATSTDGESKTHLLDRDAPKQEVLSVFNGEPPQPWQHPMTLRITDMSGKVVSRLEVTGEAGSLRSRVIAWGGQVESSFDSEAILSLPKERLFLAVEQKGERVASCFVEPEQLVRKVVLIWVLPALP